MTDERFDISRRKALAALGTIGVASAGAGLGTSAYFSDQETFENNSLVAGTLDMGVGYSAHYSDWSEDENNNLDGTVEMYDGGANEVGGSGDLSGSEVGFPTNEAWLIKVQDSDDASTFLDNTEYQSFNDGDGALESCPLGDGEQADDAEAPVISLDDVKPGDFGEVTFDFRLCDNPGFVWINGMMESSSEGATPEPELDDPDEADGANEAPEDVVELLDVVQTAVWVDDGGDGPGGNEDGNNYQNGAESVSIQPLRDLLTELNTDNGTALNGDIPAMNGGGMGDRNCFSGDTKHSIGFAWWVPVDHGNQIQGDSVSFRLGLYTEQCRHNDGSGMNNEGLANETDDQ